MRSLLIFPIILIGFIGLNAQENIGRILKQIEENNTTLNAVRAETGAEKTGNKTGLMPRDPEVEFNYLWGNPSSIGDRTDFSVVQSFDFPTAYAYRSQIAELQNEQADLEYLAQRNELLHQARLLLSELTWLNALTAEYTSRVEHARQLNENYLRLLDAGETSILEVNKSGVTLLNISQQLENLQINRRQLLSEVEQLNGGKPVNFTDSTFTAPPLTNEFQQWYTKAEQKNPVLKRLKQQIELSHKQVQLNKALGLPKLHAGYMSEKVLGEHFRGITAGVSIPLWENKNRVDYARQQAEAAAMRDADFRFRFYAELENHYNKALALQASAADYEKMLQQLNNRPLLEKALDAGQISLSEYLLELSVYYEAVDNLLEMKRNAMMAYFSLYRYISE